MRRLDRPQLRQHLIAQLFGRALLARPGEHLENCAGCRDEALVARTLTEVVARACKESAPEELRDQVLAKLRAVQATH